MEQRVRTRVGIAGLLALAGCNTIFGLDAASTPGDAVAVPDAEVDAADAGSGHRLRVTLSEQRIVPAPGTPDAFDTQVIPFVNHVVTVRFGEIAEATCTTGADGACEVQRPDATGRYRVAARAPGSPAIVLAAEHMAGDLRLVLRTPGRNDLAFGDAGTMLSFPPAPLPGSTRYALSTANWLRVPVTPAVPTNWMGRHLANTTLGDRLLLLHYTPLPTGGPGLVRIDEDASIMIASMTNTMFVPDRTPVTEAACLRVQADFAEMRVRLTAATTAPGFSPGAETWQLVGAPQPTTIPSVGIDSASGTTSAPDLDASVVPVPGTEPVVTTIVRRTLQYTSGNTGSVQANISRTTRAPACGDSSDLDVRSPVPSAIAIAGQIGTSSTAIVLGARTRVTVAWTHLDGSPPADIYVVQLFRFEGGTFVAADQSVFSDARMVELDVAEQPPGSYAVRVLASVGFPRAAEGDLGVLSLPFENASSWSNQFTLD